MPVEHAFECTPGGPAVSGLLNRDDESTQLLVLGHGAGAGMRHVFMEALARELQRQKVATFRYQFPYMEAGRRRPDPRKLLLETVASACAHAQKAAPDLPLFLGGKSMGGRMASNCVAEKPLTSVRGLVFFGFPLHPAGKPGTERAEHLASVALPMLFLQGTRDRLAPLDLLTPICNELESTNLHIVDGADHGFSVLKRSGRSDDAVLAELAATTAHWMAQR